MPIGEYKKIGIEKTRLIQKRLRISRTMACISMPEPWPISWDMASICPP